MENENRRVDIRALHRAWVWLDDNTCVNSPAGILLITPERWVSYSADTKAKFRPVSISDALTGLGIVHANLLLVYLL